MNYSTLSTKELIHYAELDATTDLERALVVRLEESEAQRADLEQEANALQAEIDGKPDADTIQGYINAIRSELDNLESKI